MKLILSDSDLEQYIEAYHDMLDELDDETFDKEWDKFLEREELSYSAREYLSMAILSPFVPPQAMK